MRRLAVRAALALLCLVLGLDGTAGAIDFPGFGRPSDGFTYTMRREVHAVDARSGVSLPFADARIDGDTRRILGVTGRVSVARRTSIVEDGGQLFVHASMPEALANAPHDLDVLVDGKDGMRVRGSIRYEPGGSRRVARLFVLPELTPGPALVEVHARGVHVADWQEIMTEEVEVPATAKFSFGWSLEGAMSKTPGVELAVEARPTAVGAAPANPVVLMSRRVSGNDDDWEEEVEDLGKLAGSKVRFVFRSRPAQGESGASPGVVWGAPHIEVEETRRAYPIVVLVSLDSLRRSSVSLYTASKATPFLESFFDREGAVMTEAATQSMTTLPSHLSLLTGLNPLAHGVTDEKRSLGTSVLTLAQLLREKGWRTAAFTEGGALAGEFGFRRGFDIYEEGSSTEIDPRSADAIERAQKWLEDYSGAPLFLFVHSYATRPVHSGIDASRDEAAREKQLRAYHDQLRDADEDLRKLFEKMEGRIDDDNALFIVTSGHGEEFFEHGAVGHGTQLYDESIKVPLLLRGSRIREGSRYSLSVGLIDVAPTILELVDAAVPASMQGRSFARLVEDGRAVLTAPRFTEARRPVRLTASGRLVLWNPPAYSVCDGPHKVILHTGGGDRLEAYDLEGDPREHHNLMKSGRGPDWTTRLTASLRSFPTTAARGAKPGGKPELSPANRSRLESLGYAR